MKCGACGEMSSHPVLLSTNTFGFADLDLRPPSMQRETMHTWVLECPHCGYVSGRLEEEPEIPMDFLKSDRYRTCDGFEFRGKLASIFYRNYMIMDELGNLEASFYSLLHCAWDCDDRDDAENARKIRKLALTYIDRMIEKDGEGKNDLLVMKSDILRRAGEFDRVIDEFENVTIGVEIHDAIIRFQIDKARLQDDACYTVGNVHEAAD
jgi:hypothetical protein